ncbi:MAG: Asp-tRNA(Asn)/Glu-tRNA(Gln) amidotransferase subunit GatB [Desulfobulbaceae bacterium]|nr:MAG: Asp-tRNA(Asn)/Glu-tRNA(Gln) amidotransferase subunit GatB [Desulfobulbaceae bacterium]
MELETVIGLEVHAQLKTNSKIFCGCSTKFGQPPNSNTCPVCLSWPGALPVLNRRVVEFALKLALATDCRINRTNIFARKHYFYPDLPSGYQTSQLDLPIAEHGLIKLELDGRLRTIGINRIHMEEDAGKLIHDEWKPQSYVDLNRAGIPLLEIVSEPDLRSPVEAVAYLRKLHAIVRYLDICDGNMQEGSFRCDANISLRPKGQEKLGVRTELKNMNSFRNVQRALEYEERRQRDLLLEGEKVRQTTLLWDADQGVTLPMRIKEDAHDYRYFSNPDLLPVVVDEDWIEALRVALPELPMARKSRFIKDLGLPAYDAEVLTADRALADYFEQALLSYPAAKKLSNWIMTELLRATKGDEGGDIAACPVTPFNLARLLTMVAEGVISGKIAKTVFAEMMLSGATPDSVVKEKNLVQVSDEGELRQIVRQIIAAQPQQAAQFRAGKTKVMVFFVGQLMKETKGKANPQVANQLFSEELEH